MNKASRVNRDTASGTQIALDFQKCTGEEEENTFQAVTIVAIFAIQNTIVIVTNAALQLGCATSTPNMVAMTNLTATSCSATRTIRTARDTNEQVDDCWDYLFKAPMWSWLWLRGLFSSHCYYLPPLESTDHYEKMLNVDLN